VATKLSVRSGWGLGLPNESRQTPARMVFSARRCAPGASDSYVLATSTWSIVSGCHSEAPIRSGGRRSFFGRSAGAALSAFVLLGAEILAFAAAVAMAQPAAAATDPVVAAAGDIGCDPTTNIVANCPMNDTANLIKGMAPGYLLPLGDVQYTDNLPQGTPPTPSMYTNGYDRAWGTIPAAVPGISVNPTAGNHDWGDPNDTNNAPSGNLANYIGYFGSKGELRPGVTASQPWYSFDIPVNGGTWHAISLDNECGANGGCGTGSPMETFLKNDLAAHPNVCTLAYWHRPRFSSGAIGSRPEYAALWTDLYNARASIVLAGSDHDYERFNRQDPNANATSTGIAQYVVGTGGAFLPGNFGAIKANSAFRDANDFGVLALTLHANSYDFAFRTTGGTTPDSGTGVACSNPAGPPGPAVSSLNPASGPASGGKPRSGGSLDGAKRNPYRRGRRLVQGYDITPSFVGSLTD